MKKIILLSTFFISVAFSNTLFGQSSAANKVVNAKTLSDEPYGINKLWLHFQPIVADVFMTNYTLGFGGQANYFLKDKIEFELKANTAYAKMFDFSRNLAVKNAGVYEDATMKTTLYEVKNSFSPYLNLQFGGSYHIMDSEIKGSSKIMLTPKKLKAMQTSQVDHVVVNSKVRRIASARGGAFMYTTTTNLGIAMKKQGNISLEAVEPGYEPLESNNKNYIYSNVFAPGFYLGGSYGTIRNITIKADKFGVLGNSTMFTAYGDIMYSPWLSIEDIILKEPGEVETVTYKTDNIKLNQLGWRAGFDIMYNQDSYFSFGGEIGARPGIAKRGMYAVAKVGFPVFSFKFKQARTVNNVGGMN